MPHERHLLRGAGGPGLQRGRRPRRQEGQGNAPALRLSRLRCQSVQPLSSQLQNFPVQIKLLPPNAPYLHNADLLIAADCTAYAYGNFHHDFMKNRVTLIGCPKLDMVDYSEKLTEIFTRNHIRSVTLTRMTVPCCGGLAMAVKRAIEQSGRQIPLNIVTISPGGQIIR